MQRPAGADWREWRNGVLESLERRDLTRVLRPTRPGKSSVEVLITAEDLEAWAAGLPPTSCVPPPNGSPHWRALRLFSLNDYMGLSAHPAVRRAAAAAATSCGMGPRSAALIGGYTWEHRELERALAELKGTEEALLFPTGFAANLAAVSALCLDGDTAVYCDELNHASLVDGARLGSRAGSTVHVYPHNDVAALDRMLHQAPPGQRKLVVTDTLFSMDGDFADLRGLAALRRRHGFLLVADEAHATLVCGERGGGAAEMLGVAADIDIHVGTLSKAFGCLGGFVACSASWRALLVNRGRAQVFSTALPLPVVAGAAAALRVSQQEPWRRRHLQELGAALGAALGVHLESPIVPVVLGQERAALAVGAALLRRGFHVPVIRPPTVPAGSSRLRLSLSADHSMEDVLEVAAAVRRAWAEHEAGCAAVGGAEPAAELAAEARGAGVVSEWRPASRL